MNCFYHAEAPNVAFCIHCGRALCNECIRNVRGSVYCEPCLGELVGGKAGDPSSTANASSMPNGGGATVSISVAATGLVIAHLIANGSAGAITSGVQDFSDLGSISAFYYAGHNSGTNPVTVAWTTTAAGRGIDACRVN